MFISKTQSIYIAIGSLLLFLFFGVFLSIAPGNKTETANLNSVLNSVEQNSVEQNLAELTDNTETEAALANESQVLPDQPDPDSQVVLNNFHRVQTQAGKKVWEIKGKRGQYFAKKQTATIESATLWIFRENGKTVKLDAAHAILHLQDNSLQQATASGDVKLTLDNRTIARSQKAFFDTVQNTITAPGFVEVEHKNMTVTGQTLFVDLNNKSYKLEQNVKTVIKPEAQYRPRKKQEPAEINSRERKPENALLSS